MSMALFQVSSLIEILTSPDIYLYICTDIYRIFQQFSWVIFPTARRVLPLNCHVTTFNLSSPNCILALTDTVILLAIWMRLDILESPFTHSAPSSSNYDLSPRVIIPLSLPPLLDSHSYLATQGFHHFRLGLLKASLASTPSSTTLASDQWPVNILSH